MSADACLNALGCVGPQPALNVVLDGVQTALKRSGGAETLGNRDAVEAYKLLRYDSPIWRN